MQSSRARQGAFMRWMSFMAVLGICGLVWAEEKPVHTAASQLELSTERVIIFKDGYGLIVKNGKATADAQGKVFTPQVPESAILGSFWAMSDAQKLLAMEAGWEEKREVREKPSRLHHNPGTIAGQRRPPRD